MMKKLDERPYHREKSDGEPPPGDGPAVSVRGLVKRYGLVIALNDISFELSRGEILGLVGPNGAGKTTLLRILATLIPCDSGMVTICGHPLSEKVKIRSIIGFMPDFLGVYEDMTVREYFEFFARAYFIPDNLRPYAVDETMHLVGMTEMQEAVVESLSRGMKQRLSLGRCLIHKPKLLLLDEPASGLDPLARLELRELLRGLASREVTIIISSHVLDDLADISDTIGVIKKGCLICSESTRRMIDERGSRRIRLSATSSKDQLFEKLRKNGAVEDIRWDGETILFHLRDDRGDTPVNLLRSLVNEGFPISSFYEEHPTLQTAYLNITKAYGGWEDKNHGL
ncbi:MAG: ABC transporter ATP-binding protein [Candidatus Eremiobacteraeota bacterium]|nr:ABC transporter ATP-binding protein [Candidatus Eremiobacteraeota bacterium]